MPPSFFYCGYWKTNSHPVYVLPHDLTKSYICRFGDFTLPALPQFWQADTTFPFTEAILSLSQQTLSAWNQSSWFIWQILHLTCDRSQAHWSLIPWTLCRAQEWQDTHKEQLKPIATNYYYTNCQKCLNPQPKQTVIPLHSTWSIHSYSMKDIRVYA